MVDRLNIVLIRVFSDLVNIGYYSVIHSDDCVTLLPLVETRRVRGKPSFLDPRRVIDKCTGDPLIKYYLFTKYRVEIIHNDPRIDLGFYTEEYRGRRLPKRKLKKGDLVLFMSGLAEYPDKIWYYRSTSISRVLRDLKREGKVGIYLIGGLFVEKTVRIKSDEWSEVIERNQVLMYSPHYYRLEDRDAFAVIGRGFYINPPLRIAKLTIHGYRLSNELISLIGRRESYKLTKQNFRKSKYLTIKQDKFENIIAPRIEFIS